MTNLSFLEYTARRVQNEAKEDLANYLIESGIDIDKFNEGLELLSEWNWNPLKTFGKSAATGAGAVLGSAFGPLGTAAGGLAGNVAGELGSKAIGKFVGKAAVQPLTPVYQQALQAVNALSTMLDAPDVTSLPDAQNLKKNVSKISSNLDKMKDKITPIDQKRNVALDAELTAGGGWGKKLSDVTGDTRTAKSMRFIGDKIKNIPILNQDMGLRRALVKGLDSVQQWAEKNPTKAALLNMGAGAAGAVTGAMAASGLQNTFSGRNQNPSTNKETNPAKETSPAKETNPPKNSSSAPTVDDFLGYHWNDKIGKYTTSEGPDGQTFYHSQDGNVYQAVEKRLKNGRLVPNWSQWQKVDPNTGNAIGRPSSITDYMKKTWKKG